MSISQWLRIEEPDDHTGPDRFCILTDEHGYALLYTPPFD